MVRSAHLDSHRVCYLCLRPLATAELTRRSSGSYFSASTAATAMSFGQRSLGHASKRGRGATRQRGGISSYRAVNERRNLPHLAARVATKGHGNNGVHRRWPAIRGPSSGRWTTAHDASKAADPPAGRGLPNATMGGCAGRNPPRPILNTPEQPPPLAFSARHRVPTGRSRRSPSRSPAYFHRGCSIEKPIQATQTRNAH